MFSKVLSQIKSPATIRTARAVAEMRAKGEEVISLCIGEPDFSTPEEAQEAAIKAIKDCDDNYPPVPGTVALRNEIVKKFARDNSLEYSPGQIIVSNGAKQILCNAFAALLNPGDEVVVLAPYWVSYCDMVRLRGATPVVVDTSKSAFRLNVDAVKAVLNEKTKAIVLNSPNNPSGVCYSEQELKSLAAVLSEFPHVYIMSDDIYEHIVYPPSKFATIAQVAPQLKDRTIVINGVSKCYAMTGWRVGYAGVSDPELLRLMLIFQEQSTSGVCSIAQAAAVGALRSPASLLSDRSETFQIRRDKAVVLLRRCEDLEIFVPEGAFYLFIDCKKLLGKKTESGRIINEDSDLADYLLNEHKIAVVCGSDFGISGYFRISYALSIELLEKACRRIVDACSILM